MRMLCSLPRAPTRAKRQANERPANRSQTVSAISQQALPALSRLSTSSTTAIDTMQADKGEGDFRVSRFVRHVSISRIPSWAAGLVGLPRFEPGTS